MMLSLKLIKMNCNERWLKPIEYCDENQFFLSEELIVSVGSTFVETSTIFQSEDKTEVEETIVKFNTDIYNLRKMIKSDSGVCEIDKHFKKVGKVKYKGPIIDYYKKVKKEYKLD